MSFPPNSSLCLKNYPRNINYMPAVIFFVCFDFEKIAIPGQPPSIKVRLFICQGGLMHPGLCGILWAEALKV